MPIIKDDDEERRAQLDHTLDRVRRQRGPLSEPVEGSQEAVQRARDKHAERLDHRPGTDFARHG